MEDLLVDLCPRCRTHAVYEDRDPDAFLSRCEHCGVLALAPQRLCPPAIALTRMPDHRLHIGTRRVTVTIGDDAIIVAARWPFRRATGVPSGSIMQLYVQPTLDGFLLTALDHLARPYAIARLGSARVGRWVELVIEEYLGLRDVAVAEEAAQ